MTVLARAREPFNWPLFIVLWSAALISILANVPYVLWLLAHDPNIPHIPLPLFIFNQLLGNGLLIAIFIWLGLRCGKPIHLGAPLVEACLAGESVGPRIRVIVGPAVLMGAAVAVVVTAADLWIFLPHLPRLSRLGSPPAWAGFLAAYYGGIYEELLLRLGIFSILAWLLWRIGRRPGGPSVPILWVTSIVVALLFGLGHLPATRHAVSLTPLVVSRALLLNGLASLVFGYQYWQRGLEAAMLTHFTTDIVADVLANVV